MTSLSADCSGDSAATASHHIAVMRGCNDQPRNLANAGDGRITVCLPSSWPVRESSHLPSDEQAQWHRVSAKMAAPWSNPGTSIGGWSIRLLLSLLALLYAGNTLDV